MRAAEAFKLAREADLPALWAASGHDLGRSGGRLTSSYAPCCGEGSRKDRVSITKEAGIWRWKCFACDQGGTAIDFVARRERIDPIEAARKIVGGSLPTQDVPIAKKIESKPKGSPEVTAAFVKSMNAMRKHGLDSLVVDYLGSRGIREETAKRAHASGLLITLPPTPQDAALWLEGKVGKALMKEAGLWSGRWPAAAYRPLIFVGPTAEVAEFRSLGAEPGSPKAIQFGRQDYPLLFKPVGEVKRIVVVEGGVDLLSMIDMGEDENSLLVGLYGTGSWRDSWAKKIAQKYAKAEWAIATDADVDGEKCAIRISDQVEALGLKHRRWRPFVGKDWNDSLKAIAA